ncbi:MAG: hypothetical protein V2J26_01065 [Pacificimonas sp.]|jgi:hypothetical protein|nr:hypothetical protein [Pacificimonas sp.]
MTVAPSSEPGRDPQLDPVEAHALDFLRRYAIALQTHDVDKVHPFLCMPVIVSRLDDTHFIRDDADLRAFIDEVLRHFRDNGIVTLEPELLSFTGSLDDRVSMVVRWRECDAAGLCRMSEDNSYTLEDTHQGWCIVGVDIAERERRGLAGDWRPGEA